MRKEKLTTGPYTYPSLLPRGNFIVTGTARGSQREPFGLTEIDMELEFGETKAAGSCGPGIWTEGNNARRLSNLLMGLPESLMSAGLGVHRVEFHREAKNDQTVVNIKFPKYSQYFVNTVNGV